MIGWVDIGKILSVIAPLYFALVLGWWWRIFTAEDSEAINRMVAWFALPFFTFEFTLHLDPYNVRYSLIAADSISKLIIVIVIGIGVGLIFWKEGVCTAIIDWCISGFSLASLTNSLVVGVPMARAMYGNWAGQVVVQLSIFQAIVWLTSHMVVLEVRKAFVSDAHDESNRHEEGSYIDDDTVVGGLGTREDMQSLEEGVSDATNQDLKGEEAVTVAGVNGDRLPLFKSVARKLACNPNLHASVIGISWACISNRSHLTLPPALEGSVQIMLRSGLGLAMFSMGLFMGQQERIMQCGPRLALLGLFLKFIIGPAAMAIGSAAVGIHDDALRVAIIQAAIPQSISSFIFAKEYGLHADVLSTA
ncbi:probable auxin efflux carrier component 5a [Oryza glaberrima]|uniref:probable auxin efflux carrier component 5a n=1 Tax=Oryza glaberrima TaxID=4538 RepID=UPI00224BF51D|nr:probable auxin efflux carrier component 5a [Oryza glaberrima]